MPAGRDGAELMRPGLFLILFLASAAILGCAGEEPDEPNRNWVLVGTDSLTGFYVGKTEGGLLTIRVEDYEYLARRPPNTPPPPVSPTEVYGMLYPDHADTVIQLTGGMYGTHGAVSFTMWSSDFYSGTGYYFTGTYSYLTLSFGGSFTSPADTGYFGGYVGSIDSVQVYCGSFAGDSLHGQWHFAVLAPALRGAGFASDTSLVLGYNGTVAQSGGSGLVTLAGTANGELGLSGSGTLDGETGSGTWALSGDFDAGTWTADRMRPDSTTARFQKLVTK